MEKRENNLAFIDRDGYKTQNVVFEQSRELPSFELLDSLRSLEV